MGGKRLRTALILVAWCCKKGDASEGSSLDEVQSRDEWRVAPKEQVRSIQRIQSTYEPVNTDSIRDLQNTDICEALLNESGNRFDTCNCVRLPDGSYNVSCDNFCQLCLANNLLDVCIDYSFSTIYTLTPDRYRAARGVTTEVHTGKDSSGSVIRIDHKFTNTGQRAVCEVFVNERQCTSCVVSTECNGLVVDCSNLLDDNPVFDECNAVQVDKVAADSVFVGRNRDLFDLQRCNDDNVATRTPTGPPPPPASPIIGLPPKKPPPLDDDKDDSKLFGEDERGNLDRSRQRKSRG